MLQARATKAGRSRLAPRGPGPTAGRRPTTTRTRPHLRHYGRRGAPARSAGAASGDGSGGDAASKEYKGADLLHNKNKPRVATVPAAGASQAELPWVERLLTLWILLAVALGLALSQVDLAREALKQTSVGSTNIPIAVGLVLMMYPPLAKVHYDWIPRLLRQTRPMTLSIVQNWIIGPLLMFFLAFAFLRDYPAYLQGVIVVGCARCIAMVIVWNEFAKGDSELCATLVALNSILTILLYAPYAYFFINNLLPAMGVPTAAINVCFSDVFNSVGVYLGIPFVMGLLSWVVLRRLKGEAWYYGKFAERISPITLIALLFTIVMLFALEGGSLLQQPMQIGLCAAPMLIYFFVMFVSSFFMAYFLECDYSQCATIAFTAASNNFELALAIAISVFGFGSPGAFATIIGPLVEIPLMLVLVNLSGTLGRLCFKNGPWKWRDDDGTALPKQITNNGSQ